jgi:solute carrier family 13 (sodium-dependent dicarboxylate transporter), member 2/3/5
VPKKSIGLYLGIFLFVIFLLLPAPDGMSIEAWRTAAVGLLMAVWWMTEALPIAATSLLPIVLFPILGILPIAETTTPYANPLVYLFMGGFTIAIAMQRWSLHKRIALNIISFVGTDAKSIIIGFIIASAFLSMWVSNTATALMMLPIALSVIELSKTENSPKTTLNKTKENTNFELVLVLCIAYACNIGGMGTLIGTPPNALLAGYLLETYQSQLNFFDWLLIGIPIVLVGLPLMYIILSKIVYPVTLDTLPGGRDLMLTELQKLGPITSPEKKVAAVFSITAFFWIIRPFITDIVPGLSDAGIAMGAALALFIIPSGLENKRSILKWTDMKEMPWGILVLFGGGLSLAAAISDSGLASWIGHAISGLEILPLLLLLMFAITVMVFLTEMTSNTATAAVFIPILASVAIGVGQNPLLFAIPAALAAGCAFMLPVATPPNAIIYASKEVSIIQMTKAGLWLNITFIAFITLCAYTLILYVFGIDIGSIPEWVN